MEDIHYLTSFRNLNISEEIKGHVELIPGVNITNDPAVKRRFLTPEFSRATGALETAHLERAPNLVFGEFEPCRIKGAPPQAFLVGILLWISDLFKNAWLLKDHAMECDAAFLYVDLQQVRGWFNNFLAVRPTFANGNSRIDVEMSISELHAWGRKNDQVEEYLFRSQSGAWSAFMMEKGYSRSGRALHFINAARSASNIAFKIAHYCSALETLFTTESSELTHKLSERVAFFLGERGYNRRNVLSTVKAAYAVRSKLVHGDVLKAKHIEELPSLSSSCDDYLRTTLNAIFDSEELKQIFDSHNKAIEDYFSQLIFGNGQGAALTHKIEGDVEVEQG